MEGPSTSRRALVASSIGNVVEWYDFAVYGAFATVIAATFFPGDDPVAGLSASFAVFATAFLARPVGALVFGRLGDRAGLRPVLATVILLGATAFVVEYAPEGRRGWYGAWLWSTLGLGVASGLGAALLLTQVLPPAALQDRGWRLAFLAAVSAAADGAGAELARLGP